MFQTGISLVMGLRAANLLVSPENQCNNVFVPPTTII